jgi:hypothetical protein
LPMAKFVTPMEIWSQRLKVRIGFAPVLLNAGVYGRAFLNHSVAATSAARIPGSNAE